MTTALQSRRGLSDTAVLYLSLGLVVTLTAAILLVMQHAERHAAAVPTSLPSRSSVHNPAGPP
jgi:hypothetical protein